MNLDGDTPTDLQPNPLVAQDYPHGHSVLWARVTALEARLLDVEARVSNVLVLIQDLERQVLRFKHQRGGYAAGEND